MHCAVLCCVGSLCADFVCNHTLFLTVSFHPAFAPQNIFVCTTSFEQTQEANKENQSQVHMFRAAQKAQHSSRSLTKQIYANQR